MTVLPKGVQLQLSAGRTLPKPVGYDVMAAFVSAEVTDGTARRNAFTLTFTLGRGPMLDYSLLRDGVFAPENRVIITALVNAQVEVLMDGVVIDQQVTPGARPGEARLVITGEDLSLLFDLEEESAVFRNQPDSAIVRQLLGKPKYARLGLRLSITETSERPDERQRVLSQQTTDLAMIIELAQRNNFVFTIEPTSTPGVSQAYWGPEKRMGAPQPALTVDMGAYTNIESAINFQFNALGPVEHKVARQDPQSRARQPVFPSAPTRPKLARTPAAALRQTIDRQAAQLNTALAQQTAESSAGRAADAVTATGEVDVARYGQVLRPRRLVGLRGVGDTFGGLYYVSEVRHTLSPGSYRQSFTLSREGVGSTVPMVMV